MTNWGSKANINNRDKIILTYNDVFLILGHTIFPDITDSLWNIVYNIWYKITSLKGQIFPKKA